MPIVIAIIPAAHHWFGRLGDGAREYRPDRATRFPRRCQL